MITDHHGIECCATRCTSSNLGRERSDVGFKARHRTARQTPLWPHLEPPGVLYTRPPVVAARVNSKAEFALLVQHPPVPSAKRAIILTRASLEDLISFTNTNNRSINTTTQPLFPSLSLTLFLTLTLSSYANSLFLLYQSQASSELIVPWLNS